MPLPKEGAAHTFVQCFSMTKEVQFKKIFVWLSGVRFKWLLSQSSHLPVMYIYIYIGKPLLNLMFIYRAILCKLSRIYKNDIMPVF